MNNKITDLHQAKLGTAVLAACIVQTLNESDSTFQDRFLARLGRAYGEYRDDQPNDPREILELLSWTRELLTGWNFNTGQGKTLLGD